MKKKMSGFTLVELLAALVILGLLTMIAAPNIVGILQSTKINTYVHDAEKLVTLAEYKFRGDSSINKPGLNQCIIMNMKYLGSGEFQNAPYGGGAYAEDESFVVIKKVSSGTAVKYEYYVQLVEKVAETGSSFHYSGIPAIKYDVIKDANNNATEYVVTKINTSSYPLNAITPTTPSTIGYRTDKTKTTFDGSCSIITNGRYAN